MKIHEPQFFFIQGIQRENVLLLNTKSMTKQKDFDQNNCSFCLDFVAFREVSTFILPVKNAQKCEAIKTSMKS